MKPEFGLPGELVQLVVPFHDSLAEILAGQQVQLQHLAGLQLHLADGRLPGSPGALVEEAVHVEQPFGESPAIVRIGVHHFVAILGSRAVAYIWPAAHSASTAATISARISSVSESPSSPV
jgi:hypothetical protein